MALFNGIKIDNVVYDVRIKYESMKRTFELIEGRNAGLSLAYRRIRDLQGTGYSIQFEVEPNPANRAGYDSLYEVLSAPVESHTIEIPFGQTSKTFEAYITAGTDTFDGVIGGELRWKGLNVILSYIAPVRTS